MKTISFLNIKGGVGKTTTSLNVAAGLAERGHRVLLIDYDPQSNTTSMFVNETPSVTINDLMLDGSLDANNSLIKAKENLFLIPSSLALAHTELELRLRTIGAQHNILKKILRSLEDKFDYCIIDCGPALSLLTVNAIIASQELIVPIKPDKFAIHGFNYTTQSINEIKNTFEIDLDYKILFTIVNRNKEEKKIIDELRKIVGKRNVFSAQIRNQPKPVVVASSTNNLLIEDKKSAVAQDIILVIDEIEGVKTIGN